MIKYITVCYNLELFCNGFAGVQKRYNKDIQLWSNGSMVVVSIMSKSIREQRKRTGFNLSFFISLVEVLQYQFHSFKNYMFTFNVIFNKLFDVDFRVCCLTLPECCVEEIVHLVVVWVF